MGQWKPAQPHYVALTAVELINDIIIRATWESMGANSNSKLLTIYLWSKCQYIYATHLVIERCKVFE